MNSANIGDDFAMVMRNSSVSPKGRAVKMRSMCYSARLRLVLGERLGRSLTILDYIPNS